jgi:hypothetical protein
MIIGQEICDKYCYTCFKYAGTAELVGIVVGIFLCTVVFSFLLLVAGALVYRYLIHCTENSKHIFPKMKLPGPTLIEIKVALWPLSPYHCKIILCKNLILSSEALLNPNK